MGDTLKLIVPYVSASTTDVNVITIEDDVLVYAHWIDDELLVKGRQFIGYERIGFVFYAFVGQYSFIVRVIVVF